MEHHSMHFQLKKRRCNAIAKLEKLWKVNEEKRKQREGNLKSLDETTSCCKRNCCSGAIDTCLLRELRRKFLEQNTQVERKRFLIDHKDPASPTGFSVVHGGKAICYAALKYVLGVSSCLLASVVGSPKARAPSQANRRTRLGFTRGSGLMFSKQDCVENFLHSMIDQFCDMQPDKGEIHLPFGHMKDVFERYLERNKNGDTQCPKISKWQFYKTWNERCGFLKIRAFHRFALCSTCVEIQEEWHKAKSDGARKLWSQAKEQHHNDVRICRAAYHYRCQRSIDFKDGLSMVVDGQEFSSFGLPHFNVFDKLSSQGWKVKSKLYGAIVHGQFSAAYVYPDYQEGGSNVTIEVIHRTLEAYVKGNPATGRPPKKLPPTFYLQLDNTFKECKNRYIFAYLKSLVDSGTFEHVYLSFLPVGHTHCDIDQMFSRISLYMRVHSAYSYEELGKCLNKAYSDITHFEVLESFANFRDAVKPLLNTASGTPGLSNFDVYRFFHFFKDAVVNGNGISKNVGVFQCKVSVTSDVWHDTAGNRCKTIPLFKDPHTNLDFASLWNVRNAIPPYEIPEQPASTIRQLQESVDFCKDRILRTRTEADALQIIAGLQKIIDRLKVARSYPFSWKCYLLYRAPPRMTPEEYRVSDELLATLQEKVMSKAQKLLENETCCRLTKRMYSVEPTQFVIVNTPAGVEEPFYVAEVIENDIVDDELQVRWYTPTQSSKQRSRTAFHQMNYEIELVHIAQSRGRQNGPQRYRAEERIDTIPYNACHFGFSRLKPNGGLFPEVQRQLRELKIIEKTTIARR